MAAVDEMFAQAKIQELMRLRRPENEFDTALELVRPEMQSSKRLVIDKASQRLTYQDTPFHELVTKEAATANFGIFDGKLAQNWTRLSLLCQYITEISDGQINLVDTQRFDQIQAGIMQQYSKSKDGRYAQLLRTMRAENISNQTQMNYQQELNKGFKIFPGT